LPVVGKTAINSLNYCNEQGTCGSIVDWGTMLQAGRSPVWVPDEVDFFNLNNPSSRIMALRLTQPLTEMSTRNLPGVKSARHIGLTTLQPSVSWMSENVGASTSRNLLLQWTNTVQVKVFEWHQRWRMEVNYWKMMCSMNRLQHQWIRITWNKCKSHILCYKLERLLLKTKPGISCITYKVHGNPCNVTKHHKFQKDCCLKVQGWT
jgi:hypothetical protein